MKPYIALLFPLLFTSCWEDNSSKTALALRTPGSNAPGANGTQEAVDHSVPTTIPLGPNLLALSSSMVNLDKDSDEEELLVLRAKDDRSSFLVLQVADYDPGRKTYFKAWESQVLARANLPFLVQIEDFIGDHSKVIVITGNDEKGLQTLNLYRVQDENPGSGLGYVGILELSSQGSLEIQRPVRSQAYELGQKNEESYKIITESEDPRGNNLLDTVRKTYEWRFQESKYLLVSTEQVKRDAKTDQALAALFTGDEKSLLGFLKGPWYTNNLDAPDQQEFLLFIPEEKTFSFYSGKALEQYDWNRAIRTMKNRISFSGTNSLVGSDLPMVMHVTITALDTITVEFQTNTSWTPGTYKKIAPSTQKTMINNRDSFNFLRKGPSGLYRNEQGLEINFDFPFFTRVENGKKESGGAALFEMNGLILQLKVLDENGVGLKIDNFLLSLSEEKRDRRTVRTLKLIPGKLTMNGFSPYNQDSLKLEQVEVVSSSE